LAPVLKNFVFFTEVDAMITFVCTLAAGAAAGFMMEKQWGSSLVRWSRARRMRVRVLRRQGVSPWRAWFGETE
jgi:hypothetical protein